MFIRTLAYSAVAAVSLAASAQAATFTLDTDLSSIDVTYVSACDSVFVSCASLSGEFNAYSSPAGGATPTERVENMINWTIEGDGLRAFTVEANLVFSAPSGATGSSSGAGLVGIAVQGGTVGGALIWTDTAQVYAPEGMLEIDLDDVVFSGREATSGADLTFVSAVPLPASVPLLIAGIGALGFVGRRKKAA